MSNDQEARGEPLPAEQSAGNAVPEEVGAETARAEQSGDQPAGSTSPKTSGAEQDAGGEQGGAQSPAEPESAESPTASGESPSPAAEQAGREDGGDDRGVSRADEPAEDDAEDGGDEDAEPVEMLEAESGGEDELKFDWYILKVQVNREESIREALLRRVRMHALEHMFGDIIVPTEDVAEYNKAGKRRIVKKKLYPGYIMVNMAIDDDSWFLVRETPGIGDFTGSAGKPTPMLASEVERIIARGKGEEGEGGQVKTAIPFKAGDQVRVKDGNFQGFEGDVESIDEAHGRVTVMINIFGRPTPVELEHWQVEAM